MIGCSTPRRISSRGLHRIGIGARIELDCKNSTIGDAWHGGRLAGSGHDTQKEGKSRGVIVMHSDGVGLQIF